MKYGGRYQDCQEHKASWFVLIMAIYNTFFGHNIMKE